MQHKVIKKHSGTLTSTEGNPIAWDLYAPHVDTGSLPLILFLHGLKGFKDWGTFPDAFFEMARHGYAVLAFNFSHNGVSGNDTFDQTELFRSQTISQELADVKTVLDAVSAGKIGTPAGFHDLYPVGIIGHSRGGHTAILAAAEFEEIACLVTWSSVADVVDSWNDAMKSDWQTKGYTTIRNSRTGQELSVGKQLFEEATSERERFSALTRIKELYIPCLFIHGTEDETVSHLDSQKLFEACPSMDKDKVLIEGGKHTYGSSHPFEEEELPQKFSEVVSQTLTWFQTYLI